jgi:hypothetical protein
MGTTKNRMSNRDDVLAGGHQLNPGIEHRRVKSKIVQGVHHVEIRWPTPQQ